MATTTPNYGWTVPTSTDLVKDGATAIETLGDAIDASMNTALGTKKAGMVLLNTTSFSGVASQSINDVFSTTYTNYRIIIASNTTNANAQLVQMRMRVSGADNSSSNYYWAGVSIGSGVASPSVNGLGSAGLKTSFDTSVSNDSTRGQAVSVVDLFNPFTTERTGFASQQVYQDNTPDAFYRAINGQMSVTTSYTGFTLIGVSGNITGNVSVYGYNK
jgi:lambda repressor-like predicted transcriptional regulator